VLQHLTSIIQTPDIEMGDMVCQAVDTLGCVVKSVEDPTPMLPLIRGLTEMVFQTMARCSLLGKGL
jgi:hypothetical protein